MILTVWNKIKYLMDNSVFFRFVEFLMNFFKRLFSGSVVIRFLSKKETGFSGSFIYKAVCGVFLLITKARDKFGIPLWEGSAAVSFFRSLPVSILSAPLYYAGLAVLPGSVLYALITRRVGRFTAVLFAAGLVCVFSKRRLYELIRAGAVMRFVSYLFDFRLPQIEYVQTKLCCPVIFGLAAGALFAFLPPVYAAAALIAPFALPLVCAYPFIGVLGIVFLMPFIPTMAVAACIIGVTVLFFIKLLTDRGYSFKFDLTGAFVLSFMIVTLIKGFSSFAPEFSVNIALLTFLFMSVYFLVVSMTDSGKKFELLVFTFSTSALCTAVYGYYQVLSGLRDTTWVDKRITDMFSFRVFSTFSNPNVYGEYLLLAIPVTAAAIVFAKRPLMKLYYATVSALLVGMLGLTYSRGCYLAIVLTVLVFVLMMEKRLVALLSAGIFILPAILPASIINRVLSITDLSDSSSKYRISIYQASVRILQNFWLSGVGQGPEAFNKVFPLYSFNAVTAPHSHNLFLQVFIETGIFGFAAFAAIFLCYFKSLVPFFYSVRETKYKWIAAALVSLMAGFMMQSLFEYSFYNYKVYMLFFVVLAFARCCVNCAGADNVKERREF